MRRVEKKPVCDPKMPKFIVKTNINKDKVPESFAGELTQQLSKALGNPAQQYLAIQISPDHEMSFGGSTDPCAMCFLYSIGKTGEQENEVCSKLLCDLLNRQLITPSDRTYISFFDISPGITPPLLEVPWGNHRLF